MDNKNITYKDIELSKITDLSDGFIQEQLPRSIEVYNILTDQLGVDGTGLESLYGIVEEDKVFLREFMIKLITCKYLGQELIPEDPMEEDLLKIVKLRELELELDERIKYINKIFIQNVSNSDEILSSNVKDRSYVLTLVDDVNTESLLSTYDSASKKVYDEYNVKNRLTDNDFLNIKRILSDISLNPTYISNLSNFNNYLFSVLVSDKSTYQQVLSQNYSKKMEDELNISDFSVDLLSSDYIVNLLVNKYFDLGVSNSVNIKTDYRGLLLAKIAGKISSDNSRIIEKNNNKTLVFNHTNLNQLFNFIENNVNDKFTIKEK